jgi:hypothetical protein
MSTKGVFNKMFMQIIINNDLSIVEI